MARRHTAPGGRAQSSNAAKTRRCSGARRPGTRASKQHAIHSAAGLELRQACAEVMAEACTLRRTLEFPMGEGVTPASICPHASSSHGGPIVSGEITDEHRESNRRCPGGSSSAWTQDCGLLLHFHRKRLRFPAGGSGARIAVSSPTLESDAPGASQGYASLSTCSVTETRPCTAPFSDSDPVND